MNNCLVAITGASGAIIGIRLIEELLKNRIDVIAIISKNGRNVLHAELGADFPLPANVHYFSEGDENSPFNSSSFVLDAMVVAPCSMKTLAGIANGFSFNLIVRAAEIQLRTNRPLILSPRETPLSAPNLKNMLDVKNAGALICPPMAAYYHRPASVDDMTNFFVGKILDLLGIPNTLYQRWQNKQPGSIIRTDDPPKNQEQ
ncbi:MAG: UbiX family flavin prenyltransferase [Candidatus Zhuqueibacterota bacterium]